MTQFYWEYETSRAFSTAVASSDESPRYHSSLFASTLPVPCRDACSKHSQSSAVSDPLFSTKCTGSYLPHLVWLHTGECIIQSVTPKCNNPFDTEKKKESMNKFSLKCDPTAHSLNFSVRSLGSFSLPLTKLHLLVATMDRKNI